MDAASSTEFHQAVANAKPQDPVELRQANEFMGRVEHMFQQAEHSVRHPCLRSDKSFDWFEFRSGELTVLSVWRSRS